MKVLEFVKLNEKEIIKELVKLDLIWEDDLDDFEKVEISNSGDDEGICGFVDVGFDFSFNKKKLLEWDVEEENIIKLNINNKKLYCCYYSF